ncbi:MAG TPA: 2-phospho-L-lactate guanylyltransferase, partial [Chloroflexi bacterium]|nr:2-phospho-L-lactate guanylyltransferase [Chloroflexota bacterium]
MSNWAIVPVKEISSSKSRLSTVLADIDRETLVIDLFIRTLSVLQIVNSIEKTIVISRDSDMLDLATKSEALAIRENDNSDLNSAIQQATFD